MILAAYAILNLDAVTHNLNRVRQLAPMAKIMAVIKANAYGHGLLRIADTLRGKVDAVAVARTDEGIQLRNAGFHQPVTVLEGFVFQDELEKFEQYQLDTVIHSLYQIELLEKWRGAKKLSVWLKMDTGMNRLGLKGDAFRRACQRLAACQQIKQPFGVMTHLANADVCQNEQTLAQIKAFKVASIDCRGESSIANSAAILSCRESLVDWVRPGIMLYGCSPFADKNADQVHLQAVMSLHSRLISVKSIATGEAVGYGGRWVSTRATRLGVVAIGYGDGYPRYAKNGTPVLINGRKVSLVGRVSMDMITVDLTSQPQARPGDPVTLWGKGLPVEEIARCSGTIPYTLLCGITRRVQILER